jgi:hypothetical protein
MTNATQDQLHAAAEDARREWIRPAIHRICAGSAEDGGGNTGDSGIEPS